MNHLGVKVTAEGVRCLKRCQDTRNTVHSYMTASFVGLFYFAIHPRCHCRNEQFMSEEKKKKEKLSSGRWHRNPKIWNEINGKIFSLFTCHILAKEIICSLKRVLPEFLCNRIRIQTLSWRPCDFIATHVHPK